MGTARQASVLILCFALACSVDANQRQIPVAGPDLWEGQNLDVDTLVPGEKIINVMEFGAKPDGVTDSTEGFMSGWQAACKSTTQARLLIPEGKFLVSPMFFAGPCLTPSAITIQVVGTVLASTDPSVYENGEWLMFEDLIGIKIFGGGTFNGQGKSMWPSNGGCDKNPGANCVRLPSSLKFNNVTNGLIQNITSVDPKGFHFFIYGSTNIRLRLVKITAPADSPNTDGIHVSHSANIKISESLIETGDDCVSMIQGVNDISINKLQCGPGHGISVGSLGKYENELEAKNILVINSTLSGTTNGVRIKAWPNKFPGLATNISFTDIVMENVKNPIIIDEEYQCPPANCNRQPSLVKIKEIHFSNIRGTTLSPIAVDLRCSKQFPCENVHLDNIDLKMATAPTGSRCLNIKPIFGGPQNPPACP